jgi:hypothetical protein
VHTIRLLQSLSNVIKERNGVMITSKGLFGAEWDKCRKPTGQIQQEMDRLLMGEILPALISICYGSILSKITFPYEHELICQIKTYVKFPDRPVSWSLAFSVHSIMTSIFEVQG